MGATLAMAAIIPLAALLPNWPFALTAGLIALGLSNMFLAPLLTIVQNRSPEHCRSLYSATFLLINNFIGAGFGSLYVGMISDAFAARYGAQSLAIAFGALAPVAIIAAALHWRVSRILKSLSIRRVAWTAALFLPHAGSAAIIPCGTGAACAPRTRRPGSAPVGSPSR